MTENPNKLKNRHRILTTLLSSISNSIVICEMAHDNEETKGSIAFTNKSFCELMEYSEDEVVGQKISLLFGELTDKNIAKRAIFAIENGLSFEDEMIVYKKHGDKLRGKLICSPIYDKNEACVYLVIRLKSLGFKEQMEHLTDAYNKESALLAQYKDAIDKSAIVSKTDLFGTITYANEHFCQTSGYSVAELIGKPHNIVRHPDTPKETFYDMWQAILHKKTWRGVVQNRHRNGESYFVDATIIPILDQDGEISEFIGIRYDITKEILARQEAQQALAHRTEFFAKASHELRTPLNIVINFAENLKEDLPEINIVEAVTKEASHFIEKIGKNARYLLSLINDILDISKVENSIQKEIQIRENLQAVLSDIYESFKVTVKQGVAFELDLTNEPIFVRTNKRFLMQIVLNILSNSAKFTKSGEIRIKLRKEDGRAVIKIIDSGRGIPKQKMDTIFEPFIQANRNDEGTGLGLKLVKELCSALNIELKVKSEVDVGTTFIMTMGIESN
jgi:PAS domain S-box-containing protein